MNESNLKLDLRPDGILTIRPQGPLRQEDFEQLAQLVDPWIQAHGQLLGVIINVRRFPGWENFASFMSHIKFVNGHEKKVQRIAIAMDGALPEILTEIADHFVQAQVQQFNYDDFDKAIQWVKSEEEETPTQEQIALAR